jgi:XapX domain-containing protein
MDYIIPLLIGGAVGFIFAGLGAYVPAPPNIQGLLGVAGITFGYMLAEYLLR